MICLIWSCVFCFKIKLWLQINTVQSIVRYRSGGFFVVVVAYYQHNRINIWSVRTWATATNTHPPFRRTTPTTYKVSFRYFSFFVHISTPISIDTYINENSDTNQKKNTERVENATVRNPTLMNKRIWSQNMPCLAHHD